MEGDKYYLKGYHPVHDKLIVLPDPDDKETWSPGGSIIVPQTAQDAPVTGRVMATGPGRTLESGTLIPLTIKVGDRVLYGKYSGADLRIFGTRYLIMREDEVLTTVPEEHGKAVSAEEAPPNGQPNALDEALRTDKPAPEPRPE